MILYSDNDIIQYVQNVLNSYSCDILDFENIMYNYNGLYRYKLETAVRVIKFWKKYQLNDISKFDFECSLRNFLLIFKTHLILKNYQLEDDNPFGLIYNNQSSKIFANFSIPSYLNEKFVKDAFMNDYVNHEQDEKYLLMTNPYIYNLTGFKTYKSIEQKLIVSGALNAPNGYTTLISMSTGSGKSLITQTVAYQNDTGVSIVIVPTISLMLDQERSAKKNIKSYNDGEIMHYSSGDDINIIIKCLNEHKTRLLFLSPESIIKNTKIQQAILTANKENYLKNLIVDEAHIIIEWGASFRIDFQCLDVFRKLLIQDNPNLRTFLLSATYNKYTVEQLKKFYSNGDNWLELRCDELRKEPRFWVIKAKSYTDKNNKVLELISKLPRPMIVYVNSPVNAINLKQKLQNFGFNNVHTFTGKTTSREREKLINMWAQNEFDIMVCTCAFGVGVDKRDVRTVLHLYLPENANKYYQELGRGGRDSLPCLSVLLYTDEDINFSQKVLTTEKLFGRWFSMLNSDKSIVRTNNIILNTSIKPTYNKNDNEDYNQTSDIDINWNVYVILLLKRNDLITINGLSYNDGVYIFDISINENYNYIRIECEETIQLFGKIRNVESTQFFNDFQIIRRSLNRINNQCWTEMFNQVYTLTDEFCLGCNHHKNGLKYHINNKRLPLKKCINEPIKNPSSEILFFMNYSKNMLIIGNCNNILGALLQKNIDNMILSKNQKDIIDNIIKTTSKSIVHIMDFDEFFQLKSMHCGYYLSGSMCIIYPNDSSIINRLITTTESLKKISHTIHIVPQDIFIPEKNKYISEIIEGPCTSSYIIEKEVF